MQICLTATHLSTLKAHAISSSEEVCGLLLGSGKEVSEVIPIPNISPIPSNHFEMSPIELLNALKQADIKQQTLIGFYHTHPSGAPIPSHQDIFQMRQNYPNKALLIISKKPKLMLQAWQITPDNVYNLEIGTQCLTNQHLKYQPNTHQWIALSITVILAILALWVISWTLLPPAPLLPTPFK